MRERASPSTPEYLLASREHFRQGRLAPPEHIKILTGSVAGKDCLCALILKEPNYIGPLAASGLPSPQVYVQEHLLPALYLSFQLGLKGVPFAQREAIDFLIGGLGTRRRWRLAW
jgi:hypothetical protein